MVAGRYFVEAIDLLLDSDLHRLNRDRDERASLETQSFLGQYGIDPSSRRLVQALRSIRTMDKEKASEQDKAEAFAKNVPNLLGQPAEVILELIYRLENTVGRIDRELFAERTRLSTISTVTRPLSTKWLERWNTQDREDFDYAFNLKKATELLQFEVEDVQDLRKWLAWVYEMFADVVVYRGSTRSPLGSAGRPAGMVGEGNERIYRRNWFSWIEENESELMQKARQIGSGDSQSAYSSSYSSAAASSTLADLLPPASQQSRPAPSQPLNEVKIDITIESSEPNSGDASRSWQSKSSLKAGLESWVSTIAGLWGSNGQQIDISVEITSSGGTTSIRIPNKAPKDAAIAAESFVEVSL